MRCIGLFLTLLAVATSFILTGCDSQPSNRRSSSADRSSSQHSSSYGSPKSGNSGNYSRVSRNEGGSGSSRSGYTTDKEAAEIERQRHLRQVSNRLVWGTDDEREVERRRDLWWDRQREIQKQVDQFSRNFQNGVREGQRQAQEQQRQTQRQIEDFSKNFQRMLGGN